MQKNWKIPKQMKLKTDEEKVYVPTFVNEEPWKAWPENKSRVTGTNHYD